MIRYLFNGRQFRYLLNTEKEPLGLWYWGIIEGDPDDPDDQAKLADIMSRVNDFGQVDLILRPHGWAPEGYWEAEAQRQSEAV